MTELEAKLFNMLMERLSVIAPFRGIEMTERQRQYLATDLAILTARALEKESSKNYVGKM